MRIGFRKKIVGIYVGASTSTKGIGKILLYILFSPFYLMYYVCIWPFLAIYRAVTKKKKTEKYVEKENTKQLASQYLRVINDCSKLIIETKNPKTFFSRYDLLLETLKKFSEIEENAPITGSKPSDELQRFLSLREDATNEFIDRYAQDTRIKIYELSTEKAKKNKANAFVNILNEYSDNLTERNRAQIDGHFRKMIEVIEYGGEQ